MSRWDQHARVASTTLDQITGLTMHKSLTPSVCMHSHCKHDSTFACTVSKNLKVYWNGLCHANSWAAQYCAGKQCQEAEEREACQGSSLMRLNCYLIGWILWIMCGSLETTMVSDGLGLWMSTWNRVLALFTDFVRAWPSLSEPDRCCPSLTDLVQTWCDYIQHYQLYLFSNMLYIFRLQNLHKYM